MDDDDPYCCQGLGSSSCNKKDSHCWENLQGVHVIAKWKGTVIAESFKTIKIEGNFYFPAEDVKHEHLVACENLSTWSWKGLANYYDITVDGYVNQGAAWHYKTPNPEAMKIKGMVAFWKGVEIVAPGKYKSSRALFNK